MEKKYMDIFNSNFLFFLDLLRYNEHITLYKFKVHHFLFIIANSKILD